MMTVDARGVGFAELNERIRESKEENVNIVGCLGQRFIACGMSDKHVTIDGVPGNAMGAYLNGAEIFVNGQCTGRSRRHDEQRHDSGGRQHRRRRRLRNARRRDLRKKKRRLPCPAYI